MNYYLSKYVGKYRVKAEIDRSTNDFCRDNNGNLCNDLDIYIKCANRIQIYHFGGNILEVYIPSIGRGHNILNAINESAKDIIFEIRETDKEVLFKVKDKNLEKITSYLRPQISGAGTSPFSPKNLSKKKDVLTTAQIEAYKEITASIPQEDKLLIGQLNNMFLSDVVCKKHRHGTGFSSKSIKDAKIEMKKEQVSLRDYFFLKGFGDEYLKFLENKISERW